MSQKPITILFVSDYCEDRYLISDALTQSGVENQLIVVENGAELLDYLGASGAFEDRDNDPLPGLILLDLDIPLDDYKEILSQIKNTRDAKHIPIIALTTSPADAGMEKACGLDITGFIAKPMTFSGMVDVMKSLGNYWLQPTIIPMPAV